MYREINEGTTIRGQKNPNLHDDSPVKTEGLIKKVNYQHLLWNGILSYNFVCSLQTMTVLVLQESDPEPARWHLISYHTLEDVRTGKLKVSQIG